LTKTNDFSLKNEIDFLYERLKLYNFQEINRELIFNRIQSSFGKLSFDVDVVKLIRSNKNDFIKIAGKTLVSLEKAVDFLFKNLYVIDSKLLPTNWHLIFITEFFNIIDSPTEPQLEELKIGFGLLLILITLRYIVQARGRKHFSNLEIIYLVVKHELIYIENKNIGFQAPQYKPSNFGSVRFCANVLYQLSQSKEVIIPETCLGFVSIKLIKNEEESRANVIYKPFMVEDVILNYQNIKHSSLEFLLSDEFRWQCEELFITDEMRDLYAQRKNKELLRIREKLIENKEQEFIERIDYT
jgi:hypothetical protein